MQNVPTFFEGKFPVAYDCDAPVCEVISLREWLLKAEAIVQALKEIQRVTEARIQDGITHERERDACLHVRNAKNLLRTSMVLVAEDAQAAGAKVNIYGLGEVAAACSGSNYSDYEVHCAHELAFLAGLFGRDLHVHYIARHPELLPHRHWMVMQALGTSFTHLLNATAEMTVADYRKNRR